MPKVTFEPDVDLDQEVVTLPSGHRYTAADARVDADWFAAHPGRPSLARGISPQVAFRVPQDLKDQLRTVAGRVGRTQSDVAREAFAKGLSQVT